MRPFLATTLAVLLLPVALPAQAELKPWGDLAGLRVDGHLHPIAGRLVLLGPRGNELKTTGHYRVAPGFRREGQVAVVETHLGSVPFREELVDTGKGRAELRLEFGPASEAVPGAKLALRLSFPSNDYPDASLTGESTPELSLNSGKGRVRIVSQTPLRLVPSQAAAGEPPGLQVSILLGDVPFENATLRRSFTLIVEGEADREEARVTIDTTKPGPVFDGIGGNFRLQFPEDDHAVSTRTRAGLRLAWARTAMWWSDWDPIETVDPLTLAEKGEATRRIREQAAHDADLVRAGLPLIVSTWDPPEWAWDKTQTRAGTYGHVLDSSKNARICESIAAYLLYLRRHHGVEVRLFSFNEPDIGVQVTQTPAEHAALAGQLGRTFARHGLLTRILIADTSNATPGSLDFVRAIAADGTARLHAGALGFHSWGGCETENLKEWASLSRELALPLLVTETGPDSEAHRSPDLFMEPSYQLEEAELHLRLCAEARPASVMLWQLTADYSVFSGTKHYGRPGPLVPTLRFHAYQQLGETPAGAFSLPAVSTHPLVVAAAFAGQAGGACAVHLVNKGAARWVHIEGLPPGTRWVRVSASDQSGRHDLGRVPVVDGSVRVSLPACSVGSLITTP